MQSDSPLFSPSHQCQDFFIMLVHHLATIFLITFSYANNMLRAGTLVMCVHDASDIFLEVKEGFFWHLIALLMFIFVQTLVCFQIYYNLIGILVLTKKKNLLQHHNKVKNPEYGETPVEHNWMCG